MEDQSILRLFRQLTNAEISFLLAYSTEASFIANKVTLSANKTKSTHLLPSTRIELRNRYILQCETNSGAIVSGLKLDFTTKFRKLPVLNSQNQPEGRNMLVLSFLEHPYTQKHIGGKNVPFSEIQVELQILLSQPSLLNFIRVLGKKPITEKLERLKERSSPIQRMSSDKNQTIFKIRYQSENKEGMALCFSGITNNPQESYEKLSCFSLASETNFCGIIQPLQIFEAESSLFCVFPTMGICSLGKLIMTTNMSTEQRQKVIQLLLRNSQNILKAGISVNEMTPENILIEMEGEKILNLYFCSFQQALFNPNPESTSEMHLTEEEQLKIWTEKIDIHKKIGLLIYFMFTRKAQIFECSSSINPDNIIGHMVELENPDFPRSAQRLILTLIHDNDMIPSLEQLLEAQFFSDEQWPSYI